jgi:hypothetical protein
MPTEEMPSEEVEAPEAEPTPTPAPGMPTTPTPAPGMPTTPTPAPGMPATPPQPTGPSEEVAPEQLGEFEVKEDLPDITKNVDPKVITLIQKANELSKQINEIATDMQNMRDDLFNKFTDINNTLDTFYQKTSSDWGKARESLKEIK